MDWTEEIIREGASETGVLSQLKMTNARFLKDAKLNLSSALVSKHLTDKEASLVALSCAVNEDNDALLAYFSEKARNAEASEEELSEAMACSALLNSNNVLYRFRHMVGKESYNTMPAKIRMSIMMNPVAGKSLFELMSLAVSAMNGCEMCVRSHEQSLIELGNSEERIFDAIRIASVVKSTSRLFS